MNNQNGQSKFPAITRRTALKTAGVAAATLAMPGVLRAASADTIKVGYISPLTGAYGLFGEADKYTVDLIKKLIDKGIENNGKTYNVEIFVRDAQSNSNKASELAGDLILNENIHLMIPASTTPVINPVADQCELYGVPSISATEPWQAFVMPRGGAKKPFQWTYHFFWGLGEVLATYVAMWQSVETNKKVGMLFPRNDDGEAWGNDTYGLPPSLRKAGFQPIAPGMFQPFTNDFTAQISEFKQNNCDIVGGIAYPADLKTFITQCSQQNYHPKVVTIAAALLFPSGVEAMGNLGNDMTSEVWWTPAFPFKSSLTGETSAEIATKWEEATGKEWTQPLGYSHALWEVALDLLKRSKNPLDRTANRDALKATDLQTLIGRVQFQKGPTPNVCTTPIFGGQWVKGTKYPFDLKIVNNTVDPTILQPEAKMQLMNWS